MSVTDPLLKDLKGYISELRLSNVPISNHHPMLLPFCRTIENIFRKGMKNTASFFGIQKRDYWQWINFMCDKIQGSSYNPTFNLVVTSIRGVSKIKYAQGRGRCFIRFALQKKCLKYPVEMLIKNRPFLESWYDPLFSVLGNEILCEIFLSLLHEVAEINFKLNMKCCTFLDETWIMPLYKKYEFVPCKDLGILVQHIDGRQIISYVEKGSVAEEDNKIELGDVLDELYGIPLRGVKRGKMSAVLKENQGLPIYMSVIKCRLLNGTVFPPIIELLQKVGKNIDSLQRLLEEEEELRRAARAETARIPPHAQLPEDELEEVPVSNPDDKARYIVKYLGNTFVGTDGSVDQIEIAINKIREQEKSKTFIFELGEKDVIVTEMDSEEEIMRHSYTEISACGRRVDCVKIFAYLAGETTCTLSKEFQCHAFEAKTDDEAKTILCSIAQGFERTHWFV
ncbi:uncharacterized protein LOC141903618 isoform X2 [Tubulanus polymorphus]|uniref:uncharacterized protein LOC141903618 isoform X2 n=1 Tax=Tubulanus polymorphus TaxID=672921 RepID=UPI003DA57868